MIPTSSPYDELSSISQLSGPATHHVNSDSPDHREAVWLKTRGAGTVTQINASEERDGAHDSPRRQAHTHTVTATSHGPIAQITDSQHVDGLGHARDRIQTTHSDRGHYLAQNRSHTTQGQDAEAGCGNERSSSQAE
jgi:hypothetical protein